MKLFTSVWLVLIFSVGNRNLVDAANIAALAALLTFRRPECTVGGEDGQEITIHPTEVGLLLFCYLILGHHFI